MAFPVRRISLELQEFRQQTETNTFIEPYGDNVLLLRALVVGPKDTPFEDRLFTFDIKLSKQYPLQPPTVTFTNSHGYRIHPNLYSNGKVCLSILGTWHGPKWSPTMGLRSILDTLSSLLDKCALRCEPGFENLPADDGKIVDFDALASAQTLLGTFQTMQDTTETDPLAYEMAREFLKGVPTFEKALGERPTDQVYSGILQSYCQCAWKPAVARNSYARALDRAHRLLAAAEESKG